MAFNIGKMFLSWFYTAVLLSFLSVPSLTGVRTIAELGAAVREGRYRCVTRPGAYTPYVLLQNSKKSDFVNIIGQSLIENKGNMNFEEVLQDTTSTRQSAFITVELNFLPYKDTYFISEDGFFTDLIGIGLRNDFCCKAELDTVINYIWISGHLEST